MGYVIDRSRALCEADTIAIIGIRKRRLRSRVILKDNSLYHTLTKPKTFMRLVREKQRGAIWVKG